MATKSTWDDSHDKILLMRLFMVGETPAVITRTKAAEVGEEMGFNEGTVRSVPRFYALDFPHLAFIIVPCLHFVYCFVPLVLSNVHSFLQVSLSSQTSRIQAQGQFKSPGKIARSHGVKEYLGR